MRNTLLASRLGPLLAGFLLLVAAYPASGQEKSVRPGINDQYRKADLPRESQVAGERRARGLPVSQRNCGRLRA